MLNKHLLFTAVLLSIGAQTYANIPIESRGLSQNTGSSLSGTSPAAPININWELMQKNQQLENEIRSLRGKLEEQDNEIEKLKNDLQNRYTDLDQRLELLNQKLDPDSSAADPDAQSNTAPPANSPTNTASPTNTTIAPSAASNSAAVGNNTPPPTTNQQDPVELEKAAYTVALDAYKQGGAKKAIAPMQNFIKNHPNSIYTGNAYFWLAEFNLATDPVNYSEAKKNYDIVVKRYPTSSKAPRSLYQLYSIAKDVEHNTTAANQLKAKLLKTYPQAEEVKYFK
ncbi:YbgF trimerization domain-containing protein [Acinetobacter soli]|uniref:YbgF trimerization domain-containing protein n=1 Tax=Acinetobacter soli TaxID=487316 RepID=UPI00125E738D|nr:YbgF trimerization domain-containing protein [Acinetobacter soli]MCF3128119.1 tetratricopeptide repeat protein [Acinetobacter soli]